MATRLLLGSRRVRKKPLRFIPRPKPGEESVWDYPRPPRLEEVAKPVRVELGDAGRLVCWCAPGLCHGDVLARFLAGEELAAIRFDLLVLIGETRDLFG